MKCKDCLRAESIHKPEGVESCSIDKQASPTIDDDPTPGDEKLLKFTSTHS